MSIIQAAVGDNVKEFGEDADLSDVWAFVNQHLAHANVERAVVLRDSGGATIGELWDSCNFYAFWETPDKMRAYFNSVGFDQND